MAGWAFFWSVKTFRVLNQFFHTIRRGSQYLPDIGFRKVGFTKPPYRVDRILCTKLSFVDPFNGLVDEHRNTHFPSIDETLLALSKKMYYCDG
jgi:hypothetical protein